MGTIGCYVKVKLAPNVKSLTLGWTCYHQFMGQINSPLKCTFDENTAAGDTIFTRADVLASDYFTELGKTQEIPYPIDIHLQIYDLEFQ